MYDLENLFKTQVSSRSSQRSSTLSSKMSFSSSSSDKDAPNKIEELFYKESHCKDVNFSHEDKENKVPSIKPIIANKKTCTLHGNRQHETSLKPKAPCKVHGHQSIVSVKDTSEKETKQVFQVKQTPPAYKYPPKVNLRLLDEQENQHIEFTDVESSENELVSNRFTCPEFLTNLILPTNEPEIEDVLAAVGVQSAKGKDNFFQKKQYRKLSQNN